VRITYEMRRLEGLVSFTTGKLNSNAAKPDGKYPFYTCSQETFLTDTWSFEGEYVLLAGNNAAGVYPLKYFVGKFDAYQRTYAIRTVNERSLLTRYLYYALRPQLELLKSISTGAATKFLTLTLLNQTEIPVPPVSTQRKIASILSAYDDLIENNLRRIKILEEMAQALYREWFVKFRFPGHEKVQMVDSPLGKIPEGWEVKTLGDLADQIRDGVNPDSVDPETPYFGLEHLPRKSIALADWGLARVVQSTKLLFHKGDILFGKIRPYFHKVGVAPLPGVCSSDTIVIRPKSADWFGLVLGCTSSEEFVEHATATSQGTKMPRANWDVLVKYQIPMPPEPVLGQLDEFVSEIVRQLHNFVFRNKLLRQTRDLLLPKLISRELDVSDLDISIPEEAA
jgi:type I restriction enzyme, S subunit